jgi:uncharacterized membrane protein YbhN (UPF0104 family)
MTRQDVAVSAPGSGGSAEPSKAGSRLWVVAKIGLATALVALVGSRTNWSELMALKKGISPCWLAISLLTYLAGTWALARRYWYMLGRTVSFRRVLSVVIQQNVVSTFGASSAGAVSYVLMLKGSDGVAVTAGIGSLLLSKVGDLLAATVGLGAAAAIVWTQIGAFHDLLAVLLTLGGCGLCTCTISFVWRHRVVTLLGMLLKDRLPSRVTDRLQALEMALARPAGWGVVRLIVLSVLMEGLSWASNYALLKGLALEVSAGAVLMTLSLCQMMSILPIQVFGGLGVSEVTGLGVYGLFGLAQGRVASVLLADRVLSYLWVLVPIGLLPLIGFRASDDTDSKPMKSARR